MRTTMPAEVDDKKIIAQREQALEKYRQEINTMHDEIKMLQKRKDGLVEYLKIAVKDEREKLTAAIADQNKSGAELKMTISEYGKRIDDLKVKEEKMIADGKSAQEFHVKRLKEIKAIEDQLVNDQRIIEEIKVEWAETMQRHEKESARIMEWEKEVLAREKHIAHVEQAQAESARKLKFDQDKFTQDCVKLAFREDELDKIQAKNLADSDHLAKKTKECCDAVDKYNKLIEDINAKEITLNEHLTVTKRTSEEYNKKLENVKERERALIEKGG